MLKLVKSQRNRKIIYEIQFLDTLTNDLCKRLLLVQIEVIAHITYILI